jgi:hypothetical protein
MFTLDEKHLDKAKEFAAKHRRKKSCDDCYDRGWIGTTDQNLLVLCTRCVDLEAALADWKAYVSEHEELKEHFAELFEEKEVEEAEESKQAAPVAQKQNRTRWRLTISHNEESKQAAPVAQKHRKENVQARNTFVPGQKRMGHSKKIG